MNHFGLTLFCFLTFIYIGNTHGATVDVDSDKNAITPELRMFECKFNNFILQPGETSFLGGCYEFRCKGNGRWKPIGPVPHPPCRCCRMINDPHIWTADHKSYNYHKTCEYSAVQMVPNGFPNPPAQPGQGRGCFTEFKQCANLPGKTCLHKTRVQFSAGLSMMFTHAKPVSYQLTSGVGPNSLPINGNVNNLAQNEADLLKENANDNTENVLIFKFKRKKVQWIAAYSKNCFFVLCPKSLRIYCRMGTRQFAGLCGNWNYNKTDDCMKPNGVSIHNSQLFGDSWFTHKPPGCTPQSPLRVLTGMKDEEMDEMAFVQERELNEHTCTDYKKFHEDCSKTLNTYGTNIEKDRTDFLITSCVDDLCSAAAIARTDQELKDGMNVWHESTLEHTLISDLYAEKEKIARELDVENDEEEEVL